MSVSLNNNDYNNYSDASLLVDSTRKVYSWITATYRNFPALTFLFSKIDGVYKNIRLGRGGQTQKLTA